MCYKTTNLLPTTNSSIISITKYDQKSRCSEAVLGIALVTEITFFQKNYSSMSWRKLSHRPTESLLTPPPFFSKPKCVTLSEVYGP